MDNTRPNIIAASDEQLFSAYVGGDKSAFALLVHRYERDLFRFLRRFVGDATAAEDLFQETFLQVHQSAAKFDLTRSFRPWLFTIAANKARDLLRARARRSTLSTDVPTTRDGTATLIDSMASPDAGPADRAESADLFRRINATVQALPALHREVVLLAYFHQFPYREIAQVLDLPLGTVKSRLHVAMKAFTATWTRANPPPVPRRHERGRVSSRD